MFADITKSPPPPPQIDFKQIELGLSVLAPLTRRGGNGPGIVVVVADAASGTRIENGVPSPMVKWAEEGYAVAEVKSSALASRSSDGGTLLRASEALKQHERCNPKDKFALIVYDSASWNSTLEAALQQVPEIVATVLYASGGDVDDKIGELPSTPLLVHRAASLSSSSTLKPSTTLLKQYSYAGVKSSDFATPFTADFHYSSEAVSHTRNLSFLKPKLGGPFFDLETLWEEHTYYEFGDRSVEHTMSTMVQEPYVNDVPTLTGGVGRKLLTQFYKDDFIFRNPADAELELISRTMGIDRVIDEFIFKFTHDQEMPWMLPGVPLTGVKVEVPCVAIINIRGDRLYHEHIHWDQGTVLRQLGLMPEYLPVPPSVFKNNPDVQGLNVEYRVPVVGADVAAKLRDRSSVPSNEMLGFKVRVSNTR